MTAIFDQKNYDADRDRKFHTVWLIISLARIFTSFYDAKDETLVEVHIMNAINNFFFFWYII